MAHHDFCHFNCGGTDCQAPSRPGHDEQTHYYRWTTFGGDVTQLTLRDCPADEAAVKAIEWGWTAPRWWQWWRANDCPRKTPNVRAKPGATVLRCDSA